MRTCVMRATLAVLGATLGAALVGPVPDAPPLLLEARRGGALRLSEITLQPLLGLPHGAVQRMVVDRQWLRLRGGSQPASSAPTTGQWTPDMELLQVMHELLEKTLVAAGQDRADGELGLEQLQKRTGFVPGLFMVVGTAAVRLEIRLAAALYCKNFISKTWGVSMFSGGNSAVVQTIDLDDDEQIVEPREGGQEDMSEASNDNQEEGHVKPLQKAVKISAGDREAVLDMLVPVYLAASAFEPLRKPMGDCVRLIAQTDYPERMPNLLPAIVACLQMDTQPLADVVSALLLLREVSRAFDSDLHRDHGPAVLDEFLAVVLQVCML